MEICPSKGSKRIEWNPTLDKQYEALVEAVQNAETIYYPDYSLPFYITSDACQYGIGAYLSQFHGNSEKILGYFSKKIDSTVKARNPTFTEAISLREAIYYFKPITRGHLTYLRTDHKNLVNIVNNGNNPRYGTLIEAVESGNYKICFINALNNPVADDLSRYGVVNTIIEENLLPKRILTKEIQLADDDIKSGLESKKYILENELIMFEKEGEKLPVIPRDVIKDVLFIAHDQSGHYSYKKTLDTISNKCFFESMKKIIHDYCRTCHECQLRNISPTIILDDKAVIYTKPNECIAIDICGKISPASNSYCYVLGIIDCFSRFVTLIPLRRYDYSSVSKALFHQYFYIHGLPSQVYVDGGGNFKNKKLKKMMVDMKVNLTNTIPYYSKSNTIIERMFKQMQNCIAKYDGEWSELLPACAYYHNVMEHSTTEKSPYYLHFLREPNTGLDIFVKKANFNEIDYDRDKTDLQAYAIKAYKIAENAIKKNRNFKEIENEIIFKPGEEVLVLKKQNRNKFDNRYEGPFIIKSTDQRNANLYRSPGKKFSLVTFLN